MLHIKPISDLRNYDEVLKDCIVDSPVYLTENGRGRYVLVDIAEYERKTALLELYAKLAEGEKQLEEGKYISWEAAKTKLRSKYAE